MIDSIRRHEYTLIIDENVDVLTKLESDFYDIEMALDAGLLTEDNGVLRLTDKKYRGTALSELFDILEGHDLMKMLSDEPNALFFWMLPKELLTSFKNVFVLTYLFEAQSLHHFFHMYNIPYEYIGVERTNTGNGYRFCEHPNYVPEYVTRIKDMIHIMDNPKLNSVGDHPQALSLTWFKRGGEKPAQLKRNIHNIVQNIWKGVPRTQKMWGTFKSAKEKMKGVGYTKLYLNFNHRASNDYRDRTHFLYIVNIYMNVDERNFYQHHGIEVNEDMYALSTMVQWIWRSAIRDGKEIELYMPSSRMRRILTEWMNSF